MKILAPVAGAWRLTALLVIVLAGRCPLLAQTAPTSNNDAVVSLTNALHAPAASDRMQAIQHAEQAYVESTGAVNLLPQLIALLHDPSPLVREQATRTLGDIWGGAYYRATHDKQAPRDVPAPQDVEQLASGLHDADGTVQRAAAVALLRINDARGIAAVTALLQQANTATRGNLLDQLSYPTEPLIPVLIELLRDPDDSIAQKAHQQLSNLHDPQYIEMLEKVQQGQRLLVRVNVVDILGSMDDQRARDFLAGMLSDADMRISGNAAYALLHSPYAWTHPTDPRVVNMLLARAQSPDKEKRDSAVATLTSLQAASVTPEEARRVTDVFASYLNDPNVSLRYNVAFALGEFGDARALPVLGTILRNAHVKTRQPVTGQATCQQQQDIRERVLLRNGAVNSLGNIRDPRAATLLLSAVQDADEQIRISAISALAHSKAPNAISPATIQRFSTLLSPADHGTQERMAVVDALMAAKSPQVVAPLLMAMRDPDSDIRKTAIYALQAPKNDPQVELAYLHVLPGVDVATRRLILQGFAKGMTDARAVDTLLQYAYDPDAESQRLAMKVLAHFLADPRVFRVFVSLTQSPDPQLRDIALFAQQMRRNEHPTETASALQSLLHDKNLTVRRNAVTLYAEDLKDNAALCNDRAKSLLQPLAHDPDPQIRQAALDGLLSFTDPSVNPALVTAFQYADARQQQRIIFTLDRQDPQTVPLLLKLYPTANADARATILMVLSREHTAQIQDFIHNACTDPDPHVRQSALGYVKIVGDPNADAVIRYACLDPDPDVKQTALRQLMTMDDSHKDAIIFNACTDPNPKVRQTALNALEMMNDPLKDAVVFHACADPDPQVRQTAFRVLVTLADPRKDAILTAGMTDADLPTRLVVLQLLANHGDPRALDPLLAMWKQPDPRQRQQAINLLGWYDDPRVDAAILAASNDAAVAVRNAVIGLLFQRDAPRATAILLTKLADKDPAVASAAAMTLASDGDYRVVPALIARMRTGDPQIRQAVGLGGIYAFRDPLAIGTFAALLHDPDHDLSYLALLNLGAYADMRARDPLLALWKATKPNMENTSVLSDLGNYDDPRAVNALWDIALQDDAQHDNTWNAAMALDLLVWRKDPRAVAMRLAKSVQSVRGMKVNVLQQLADPRLVEPWLVADLIQLYRYALSVLQIPRDPLLVQPAMALLQDPAPQVRALAVSLLAHNPDASSFSLLRATLRHDADDTVRALAAQALGAMKDERATPDLLAALQYPSTLVRAHALLALGALDALQAFDPAVRLLNTGTADEQFAAAHALGNLDDGRALAPLLAALHAPDAGVRGQAAWALGELKNPQAIPALISAVQDPDPAVPWQAIRALGRFHDAQATQTLLAVVTQSITPAIPTSPYFSFHAREDSPRLQAIRALGNIGDPQAVEPLCALLSGHDPLADEAATALGILKDPRAVAPLISALKTSQPMSFSPTPLIIALGEIGDARAVEALLPMLNNKSLRPEVITALTQLNDLRAVPPLIAMLARCDGDWRPLPQNRPTLRERLVSALTTLTGQPFGDDAAKWQAWWREKGKE